MNHQFVAVVRICVWTLFVIGLVVKPSLSMPVNSDASSSTSTSVYSDRSRESSASTVEVLRNIQRILDDLANNPHRSTKLVKQDEADNEGLGAPINALVNIRDGVFTQFLAQLLSPFTGEIQRVVGGFTHGILNFTGLRVPTPEPPPGPPIFRPGAAPTGSPILLGSVDDSGQFQFVQAVTAIPLVEDVKETTPHIRFPHGGDGGAVGKLVGGLVKGIVSGDNAILKQPGQGPQPVIYVLSPQQVNQNLGATGDLQNAQVGAPNNLDSGVASIGNTEAAVVAETETETERATIAAGDEDSEEVAAFRRINSVSR